MPTFGSSNIITGYCIDMDSPFEECVNRARVLKDRGRSTVLSDGFRIGSDRGTGPGFIGLGLVDERRLAGIPRPVRCEVGPRHGRIERDGAADVGAHRRSKERKAPSHAEANNRDPIPLDLGKLREGSGCIRKVICNSSDIEAEHELLRLVRFRRLDSPIVVDSHGNEARVGEPLENVANMWDKAPPLLHDDDPGTATGGGTGDQGRDQLAANID